MKTILLMRHAKAEPGAAGQDDFDRGLAGRGDHDAREMGEYLRRIGAVPDLVVTSDAKRARKTAELAAGAAGVAKPLHLERALYDAAGSVWIDVLRALPRKVERPLVVAHMPGIAQAAALLLGSGAKRAAVALHFPTAAIACVQIDADDWEAVAGGGGELRWLVGPKGVG